jgi:hypothetical protein
MGDRYVCSDSSCGCEIEVKTPSSRLGAGSTPSRGIGYEESGSGKGMRTAESQPISTPGDFGSQGATGEGTFGTSAASGPATTQGRYGSSIPRATQKETPSTGDFICCCGELMQKTGQRSSARA